MEFHNKKINPNNMGWGVVFSRGKRHVLKNNKVGFAYRWWIAEQRSIQGTVNPVDRTLKSRIPNNDVKDYLLMLEIRQKEKDIIQKKLHEIK